MSWKEWVFLFQWISIYHFSFTVIAFCVLSKKSLFTSKSLRCSHLFPSGVWHVLLLCLDILHIYIYQINFGEICEVEVKVSFSFFKWILSCSSKYFSWKDFHFTIKLLWHFCWKCSNHMFTQIQKQLKVGFANFASLLSPACFVRQGGTYPSAMSDSLYYTSIQMLPALQPQKKKKERKTIEEKRRNKYTEERE